MFSKWQRKVALRLKGMSVTVKEDQQLQMLEKHQGQIHVLAAIISVNQGFHQFITEDLLLQFCIQDDAIQELTS